MHKPSISHLTDAQLHTLLVTTRELYEWKPGARRCSLRDTSRHGLPKMAMPGYVLGVAAEILGYVPNFLSKAGNLGNINGETLAALLSALNDQLPQAEATRFATLIVSHGNRHDQTGTKRLLRKALFFQRRNPLAKFRHRRKRRKKNKPHT